MQIRPRARSAKPGDLNVLCCRPPGAWDHREMGFPIEMGDFYSSVMGPPGVPQRRSRRRNAYAAAHADHRRSPPLTARSGALGHAISRVLAPTTVSV